jgi:hypothetical protein
VLHCPVSINLTEINGYVPYQICRYAVTTNVTILHELSGIIHGSETGGYNMKIRSSLPHHRPTLGTTQFHTGWVPGEPFHGDKTWSWTLASINKCRFTFTILRTFMVQGHCSYVCFRSWRSYRPQVFVRAVHKTLFSQQESWYLSLKWNFQFKYVYIFSNQPTNQLTTWIRVFLERLSHSASQILRILWNPKVYYHVHRIPPLIPNAKSDPSSPQLSKQIFSYIF